MQSEKKLWSKIINPDYGSDFDSEDERPLSLLHTFTDIQQNDHREKLGKERASDENIFQMLRQLDGCGNITEEDLQQLIASHDVEHKLSIPKIVDTIQRSAGGRG